MICLDSTALIEILKGGEAGEKVLVDLEDEQLCTTELNRYEILRGASRYGKTKEQEAFAALCGNLAILPLSSTGSEHAAKIYGDLSKAGKQIGDVDCLIAGIMLANDVDTLVTKNAKHFKHIQGITTMGHS